MQPSPLLPSPPPLHITWLHGKLHSWHILCTIRLSNNNDIKKIANMPSALPATHIPAAISMTRVNISECCAPCLTPFVAQNVSLLLTLVRNALCESSKVSHVFAHRHMCISHELLVTHIECTANISGLSTHIHTFPSNCSRPGTAAAKWNVWGEAQWCNATLKPNIPPPSHDMMISSSALAGKRSSNALWCFRLILCRWVSFWWYS